MELKQKEEVLNAMMMNAPTQGLTSVESDLLQMQQQEDIKCTSAGGLWGIFSGPKIPMVSSDSYHTFFLDSSVY